MVRRAASVDLETEEPEACHAAYEDESIIIQYDDGETRVGGPPGRSPTRPLSLPIIVAIMLEATEIETGMRVLDIGTGSGWGAALLSARPGA